MPSPFSGPFAHLADLREIPIPPQAPAHALVRGYRETPLDLTDSRAAEPLVDVTSLGIAAANHYAHDRNPPYYAVMPGSIPGVWLREGAAARLAAVNARLAGAGLELLTLDGWRSTALQAHMHDVWVPNALRQRFPGRSEAEIAREVGLYWAAPTVDPRYPAPHATGGAVDLTLRWIDSREPLWMGSLFDETSGLAHPDHFERASDTVAFSDEEARRNRRLLHHLMTQAGFAQNPTEWWHYGHGELMWARLTGAPAGLYGMADPPV
jgi:D-alanyl-D-alanine dipeptidase